MNKALEVVCTTHRLPFAQIWIPCPPTSCYTSYLWCLNNDIRSSSVLPRFMVVCRDHLLRKGQGVVGTALLSRKPCYCRDVSQLPIADYPLSHYARHYGLTGCFAICLRSTTLTKNHDYVVEFFFPRGNTISGDLRLFLESIFATAKKHLQGFEICLGGGGGGLGEESYVEVLNISTHDEQDSFKIFQKFGVQPISESLQNERREEEVQNNVTGEAFVVDNDDGWNVFGAKDNDVALACLDKRVDMLEEVRENNVAEELCFAVAKTATNVGITSILPPTTETLQNDREVVQLLDDESAIEGGRKNEGNVVYSQQNSMSSTSSGRLSGREETSEREFRTDGSLSHADLKQYFGKKLDDAAYILGVSRSTMKRACRVHGIKKWPSPKRKKVKPSPSNLNHVNAFVQGGNERVPKFGNGEPSCSNLPPTHTTGVVAHTQGRSY